MPDAAYTHPGSLYERDKVSVILTDPGRLCGSPPHSRCKQVEPGPRGKAGHRDLMACPPLVPDGLDCAEGSAEFIECGGMDGDKLDLRSGFPSALLMRLETRRCEGW